MKGIKLLTFLFFTNLIQISFVMSQTAPSNTSLKHYLRKTSADTLLLPGDSIVSEHLLIKVPDSIYVQSEIKIKKFNYQDIPRIHVDLTGQNSIVRTVEYTLKGRRKAEKFLVALMREANTNKETLEEKEPLRIDGVRISFIYKVEKRHHFFNFSIAE